MKSKIEITQMPIRLTGKEMELENKVKQLEEQVKEIKALYENLSIQVGKILAKNGGM